MVQSAFWEDLYSPRYDMDIYESYFLVALFIIIIIIIIIMVWQDGGMHLPHTLSTLERYAWMYGES